MKKISGFTILELLFVIAIASTLLAIGVPALQQFIQKGKLTTFGNELVSAVQVSRSSAIQLALPTCVCASTNAGAATPACNGDDNWEDGWIAFIDTNTAATNECVFDSGDGDVLLKIWDGSEVSDEITFRNNNATINSMDYIRFNRRGNPVTGTGAILQGMFKLCDSRGLTQGTAVVGKGIILSASGSLRTTKDASLIVSCL